MKKYYLLKMKEYELLLGTYKTLLQYAIQNKDEVLVESYSDSMKYYADSWAEYKEKLDKELAKPE